MAKIGKSRRCRLLAQPNKNGARENPGLYPSYGAQYPGAIYQDEIVLRQVLSNLEGETIDKFLLEFFERIHEQTGYPRPSNLCGFPGPRPYSG